MTLAVGGPLLLKVMEAYLAFIRTLPINHVTQVRDPLLRVW